MDVDNLIWNGRNFRVGWLPRLTMAGGRRAARRLRYGYVDIVEIWIKNVCKSGLAPRNPLRANRGDSRKCSRIRTVRV